MIDECAGSDPAPILLDRPGIVAGIGLRDRANCQDVLALLDACLAELDLKRQDLVAITSSDRKGTHPALLQAAAMLGVPLLSLPASALSMAVPNPSSRVAAAVGLNSVAEAAALTFGPLMLEKQRSANVTCALSAYCPAGGVSASASIAAATLSTSSAGP